MPSSNDTNDIPWHGITAYGYVFIHQVVFLFSHLETTIHGKNNNEKKMFLTHVFGLQPMDWIWRDLHFYACFISLGLS